MENARKGTEAGKSVDLKKAKADFELHVLLIMRKDNVPKPKATWTAWLEGPAGLNIRLDG